MPDIKFFFYNLNVKVALMNLKFEKKKQKIYIGFC